MKPYIENMNKAIDDLQFARDSLRAALRHANSVEGIVLLQLIEKTTTLEREAMQLRSASEADGRA